MADMMKFIKQKIIIKRKVNGGMRPSLSPPDSPKFYEAQK
jgi:hypothetical protein